MHGLSLPRLWTLYLVQLYHPCDCSTLVPFGANYGMKMLAYGDIQCRWSCAFDLSVPFYLAFLLLSQTSRTSNLLFLEFVLCGSTSSPFPALALSCWLLDKVGLLVSMSNELAAAWVICLHEFLTHWWIEFAWADMPAFHSTHRLISLVRRHTFTAGKRNWPFWWKHSALIDK